MAAGLAHVAHPATLGAAGLSLCRLCNTGSIVIGNQLEIGGLLAAASIRDLVCHALVESDVKEGTRFHCWGTTARAVLANELFLFTVTLNMPHAAPSNS